MSALWGPGAAAVLAASGSTDQTGTIVVVLFVIVAIGVIVLAVKQLGRVQGKFDPTLQDRPHGRHHHHGDAPAAGPDDPDRPA
jgi:hypothetical protein